MKFDVVLLVFIVFSTTYLCLTGLGNNVFWDDEADTAFFASNLLEFGSLSGWSGSNLWGYGNGAELNGDLVMAYDPPLQYYVCALSFLLLGESTFTARLPFTLLGVASVLVFFFLLKRLGLNDEAVCFSTLVYALNPSFLLFIRQARYFAPALLFSVLTTYFYLGWRKSGKLRQRLLTLACAVVLFYFHYLSAVLLVLSLLGVELVFHKKGFDFKSRLSFLAVFSVFTLPYLILNNIWGKASLLMPATSEPWVMVKLKLFLWQLFELNRFDWLTVGVALFFAAAYGLGKLNSFQRKIYSLLFLFCLLYLFGSAFLSSQTVSSGGVAQMRYNLPLLFVGSILTGMSLNWFWRRQRTVAGVLLALIVLTNFPSLIGFQLNFIDFVREIHSDYTTPYEHVIGFLEENADAGDSVYCSPKFTCYPLMYYLGDRVFVSAQLNEQTPLPADKVMALDPGLFVDWAEPDWVLFFGLPDYRHQLLRYYGRGQGYRLHTVLDVFALDLTRPETPWHRYPPLKPKSDKQRIHVYERVGR